MSKKDDFAAGRSDKITWGYWFEPNPEQVGQCKDAYTDSMSRWAREAEGTLSPDEVM